MKKINSSSIRDDYDYNNIPIEIDHIVVNPDKRVYVILTDGERQAGLEITSFEASMLSFVHKELHKNSHINTIHQLFVKFINDQNTKIESIYLESKVGDIIYASIHFVDNKHRRYYSVCSLIDALILSLINKTQLYVVKNAWEKIDSFDDWQYDEFIIDWSNE
jgi:bifunctional DNase/RNase